MKAVVLAYHDVGCAGLEALVRAGDEVAAVYTHRDDPRESPWFGSVAARAAALGITVYRPDDINEPCWVERIRAQRPDVIFSFYYRRLVCRELLGIPRLGAMNLHGSYLPRYRGRCPVNWVLIRGETSTGVTLHYMVPRADAGDIVAQRRIPIAFDDTALTLHGKVVSEGTRLLEEALPSIRAGTNARRPQDLAGGCYVGRRTPEDGGIDWSRSALEIYNLVRGVTHPFPGARTAAGDRTLFIWAARPLAAPRGPGCPGRVLSGPDFVVETGAGRLHVLRGQLAGHPPVDGAALIAAGLIVPGEVLGR